MEKNKRCADCKHCSYHEGVYYCEQLNQETNVKWNCSKWDGLREVGLAPHPALPESWRDHNVGDSDYSKHKIQPWDLWAEYKLNPWEADIVKRILRKKGADPKAKHKEDLQKIAHIISFLLENYDNIY